MLSPGAGRKDHGAKDALYEQFGVREYWLVDPAEQYAEVYTLENSQYRRLGLFEPGQTFTSPVLSGQTIEVNAILIG